MNNFSEAHPLFFLFNSLGDFLFIIEGEPTYPDKLSITSTGAVADLLPSYLGVYEKMTNTTHSGRPVWQSTSRDDRYLLYSGKLINFIIIHKISDKTAFKK